VSKGVLQTVSKLESVDVSKAVLDVRVDDELGETEDLSTQMERVSEAGLLALLGRKGLDRLQVEIVIQMKVVEILAVNQEVEHVVTLPADLQAGLDPVQIRDLEELCVLELAEQDLFALWLRMAMLERVEHVTLSARRGEHEGKKKKINRGPHDDLVLKYRGSDSP
jgi:hypothetical protein